MLTVQYLLIIQIIPAVILQKFRIHIKTYKKNHAKSRKANLKGN